MVSNMMDAQQSIVGLISAFHDGAELMKQIITRDKGKNSELATEQKWLLETLKLSEQQITQQFSQYTHELGKEFKIGDIIAVDTFQTIAILVRSDISKSLEIVLQLDKSVLDLARLQDAANFYKGNALCAMEDLKTRVLQPMPAPGPNRNASTSTSSSGRSHCSRYSDGSDASSVAESSILNLTEIADKMSIRTFDTTNESNHRHRWSASSTTSHFGAAFSAPRSSISSISPLPSPVLTRSKSKTWKLFPSSKNTSLLAQATTASAGHGNSPSLLDINLSSSYSPDSASSLMGRPSKSNNYWGFCKGSWTIREDWRKGLTKAVGWSDNGIWAQETVWRCSQCYFTGDIYGEKKPYTIDPNVHEDTSTGVRYRWIFLAKSHTKVKMLAKERNDKDWNGYGCLFCSLNNASSGVYVSTELLFRHILDEHAPVMTEDLAMRAKCIIGRRAEMREDFDINIR